MKNILVTGGSGFFGKNLSYYLKKKYNNFRVIFSGRSLDRCVNASNLTKLKFEHCDVANNNSVVDCVSRVKPEIIIHCAATKYNDLADKFPFECIDTNVNGTLNLLRAGKMFGLKKFIAISTDKACPPLNSVYAMSKSIMEKSLILESKKTDIKIACIRFGNLPWSTGSIFPIWLKMTKDLKKVQSTGPEMTRYFFKVNEACNLVNYVIRNPKETNGKVIIPNMKSAKIKDILNEWSKIYKVNWIKIKKRPNDKDYESIISSNEYCHVKKKYTNLGELFFLDLNKNGTKKDINSNKSKKLNTSEIRKLILDKPRFV